MKVSKDADVGQTPHPYTVCLWETPSTYPEWILQEIRVRLFAA